MRKLTLYTLIVGSGIAIGGTGGFLAKKFLTEPEVIIDNIDVDSLKMNCDEIVQEIDSYTGTKDLTDQFSPAKIINYSLEKYRRCENSYALIFGIADTIVSQDIRGALIKNGENYFEESISKSSMVSLGTRVFQTGEKTDVAQYNADKKSIEISDESTNLTYSDTKTDFTSDEYKTAYGRTLDEMFIYLINEQTVISSEVTKLDSGYQIKVGLDPDLATYYYKIQMKSVSNLDKLPTFSDVNLTYTLTKELMLKHLSVDENYVAKMVVNASIHGTLETDYFPNEFKQIPSLDEKIEYVKGAN